MSKDHLPEELLKELDKNIGHGLYQSQVMVKAMQDLPKFIQARYDFLLNARTVVLAVFKKTFEELRKSDVDRSTAIEAAKKAAKNELDKQLLIMEKQYPENVYKYAVKKLEEAAAKKIDINKIDPDFGKVEEK